SQTGREKEKAPAKPGPFSFQRSNGLFQRVRNVGEGGIELRPNTLDDRDNRDRNASGDQAVFDRGGAGLILHKTSEGFHRKGSLEPLWLSAFGPASVACSPVPNANIGSSGCIRLKACSERRLHRRDVTRG